MAKGSYRRKIKLPMPLQPNLTRQPEKGRTGKGKARSKSRLRGRMEVIKMNIPNKLTMLRCILVPFFVFFLLYPGISYGNYIALAIYIAASLTDMLDGYLARKYHWITNFGKFMDPLADKLLVSAGLICFVEMNRIPSWIVIIIISREFIISGFRLVASDNGVVIAASPWGKFKTVSQMIMSVLLILHLDSSAFLMAEQVFIYLALVLTVLSLLDYLAKNRGVLAPDARKNQ